MLEFNPLHRDRNEIGGVPDPDSGGTSLVLVPGMQYVTRKWTLEATVQVPAANLNGTAPRGDCTVRAGFRVNFRRTGRAHRTRRQAPDTLRRRKGCAAPVGAAQTAFRRPRPLRGTWRRGSEGSGPADHRG